MPAVKANRPRRLPPHAAPPILDARIPKQSRADQALGFYDRHILPGLLHLVMKSRAVTRQRRDVIPAAAGRVLEIGVGSGLNLPHYGAPARAVYGLDPAAPLLARARRTRRQATIPVALLGASAENIPFAEASFDSIVSSWTLCSIPDPERALREMRRVLKPGGCFHFIEHGLAPAPGVARWQHRLTPLWRRCAGGCHLDRDIAGLIRAAGFAVSTMETGFLIAGPRPLTYHYKGLAQRA